MVIVPKLIAHRGNIYGPVPNRENSSDYIQSALDDGFDAEVDVWRVNGEFYLGHDDPHYEVPLSFFFNRGLWCHAKNLDALFALSIYESVNVFWHESDTVVLTSHKQLWTMPGAELTERSVCVMPEKYMDIDKAHSLVCAGICSDFVGQINDNRLQPPVHLCGDT